MYSKSFKKFFLIASFALLALVFSCHNISAKDKKEKTKKIQQEQIKINDLNQAISEEDVRRKRGLPDKATVDITADEIRYNDTNEYYEAKGNSEAFFPDKDATLFADKITYNGVTKLIEAHGAVKVVQGEDVIKGSYAAFNLNNDKYHLEEPKVFVSGLKLKARLAHSTLIRKEEGKKKEKNVIKFDEGIMNVDNPFRILIPGHAQNTRYIRTHLNQTRNQPLSWQDLPEKPILKYSAKEITYDDTKKVNNLKINGARLHVTDNISVPSPIHITTTVGEYAGSRLIGPIFGQRTRLGGFVFGPRFYKTTDHGVYSLAPVGQIGNGTDFGGGLIASFSTPGDATAILAGYGSLDNRFIVNAHQQLPVGFEVNFLENQFKRRSSFGATQVGRLMEVAHNGRLRLPFFFDRRSGIRTHNSIGFAKDNADLFSARRLDDLREARGDEGSEDEENADFRTQHDVSFYTNPFIRFGNEFYNFSLSGRGQGSLRFYGSGDIFAVARGGPSMEVRLRNIAFELSYLVTTEAGQSPFLFDQFVDGTQAIILDGDYRVNDWISLGTFLSYNLDEERFTQNQVRTQFGPDDFKFRFSYDTIRNQVSFGVNMIMGDPLKFDRLNVKTD